MSQLSLVERAQLGQVDAIAALMNASLRSLGIQARATLQDNRLHVLLEAAQPPDQRPCIEFIRQGMAQLQRVQVGSAVVYGRMLGQTVPSWVQQIELTPASTPSGITVVVPPPSESPPMAAAPTTVGVPTRPTVVPAALQTATIQIPAWLEQPDAELIEMPEAGEIAAAAGMVGPGIEPVSPEVRTTATAQLVHRPRGIGRRSKSHRWYGTVLRAVLSNDRLFLAVLLGVPLVLVLLGGYGLNRFGLGAAVKSPEPAIPAAPTAARIMTPIAKPDGFESALQQASVAVELSHSCQTPGDWQQVAKEWRSAIAQMQTVPPSHPNYAIAQIKIKEYQQTLNQITARHLSPAPEG